MADQPGRVRAWSSSRAASTRCSGCPCSSIRAFTFGTLSTFLSAVARGGLMFMLDHLAAGDLAAPARLQLRQHAAVGGHLHPAADGRACCSAGPTSGFLSDRFGSRGFATRGNDRLTALSFFAAHPRCRSTSPIRCLPRSCSSTAVSMGMFASPNRAGVMNSPATGPTAAPAAAMNQTFQNSAQVLSIGIFFTLMILGLASSLPRHAQLAGLHGARRARPAPMPRRRPPRCRRSRSCSRRSWATTRSSTWSGPTAWPASRPTTRPC